MQFGGSSRSFLLNGPPEQAEEEETQLEEAQREKMKALLAEKMAADRAKGGEKAESDPSFVSWYGLRLVVLLSAVRSLMKSMLLQGVQ